MRRLNRTALVVGLLLLGAGLSFLVSPWMIDGGLFARLHGYASNPGESNWLSVLSGSAASIVLGLLMSAASLLFFGLAVGGWIGTRKRNNDSKDRGVS